LKSFVAKNVGIFGARMTSTRVTTLFQELLKKKVSSILDNVQAKATMV